VFKVVAKNPLLVYKCSNSGWEYLVEN